MALEKAITMKKMLMNKHSQVIAALSLLELRLGQLSVIASEIYGEELTADLCNGAEIEFRTAGNPDGLNDIALRMEDVLAKLNAK